MRRFGFLSLALALLSSGLVLVSSPSALATYAFSSHTFTNCSATGPSGPTQAACRGAYTTSWDETANFTVVSGIQYWVVPFSGRYYVDAYGAGGGGTFGGRGARIADTFDLVAGETIRILVGQPQNGTSTAANAGGGGTFVVRSPFNSNESILVIAGGGGGAESSSSQQANAHASISTSGNSGSGSVGSGFAGAGGTSGSGGGAATTDNSGGGGGGFFSNGANNSNMDNRGGISFVGGGGGGPAGSISPTLPGGFGGGGASRGQSAGGGGAGGGGGYSGGGGGDNVVNASGGGGGSYFANGLNINRVTTAQAISPATAGYVTITSLGPSITTFAPRATLTNQASIVYDITFSQSVTGLAANDFSLSGTGSSSCTIGTPSGSGTTYTVTLSGCSPGTVILTMATNAVTNTSSQTAPASNTAAATVTIDQTLPTISATLTGPANATYIPGQSLTFTAPFSETVTVTGTPRLALTIGSTTRYANYLSGTNTRTLTFAYVVQAALADVDTDGISLATSLEPNSGSIQDLATNTLSNFTFTAPNLTSVLVAQRPAAPTITSITPSSGALSVAFTPGATNGSAITNYEFSTNNGVNWTTRNPVATTSPISITGLTNGQAYNVRLRAINGAGFGESSTAVAATPSAVVVTGDTSLTSIYGQSASTGSYSATGGTGGYTFSLSDTPTGVTINPSNGTVTTATTTPAGTYTQSVRATDSSSQVGTRSLTITVAKAATSITIALPNSATSAALGGAVTITATVPRAGAVNFQLGGSTISGCGSAAAASTTATCSWTPLALGSVSLTAIFTPTDTSNFETSTTTTLTITVVNGVSTVSLSLAGGVTQVPKGKAINIIAAIDQIGRITFLVDGKRIPGCFNLVASVIGNRSCSWKPAVQRTVNISARLVPTNNVFNPSVSNLAVQVTRRTGPRG